MIRLTTLFSGLILISGLLCATPIAGVSFLSSNIYTADSGPCTTSIVSGSCESSNIFLFGEASYYTLTRPVGIDFDEPGLLNTQPAARNLLSLPAGVRVFSYFVQFDPVGVPASMTRPANALGLPNAVARIVFDADLHIVGIQTLGGTLNSGTNAFNSVQLRNPGLTYDTANAPGLELGTPPSGNNDDWINWIDAQTIEFKLDVNTDNVDGFRILLETPEPAVMGLTGFGLLGIAGLLRRRRR